MNKREQIDQNIGGGANTVGSQPRLLLGPSPRGPMDKCPW